MSLLCFNKFELHLINVGNHSFIISHHLFHRSGMFVLCTHGSAVQPLSLAPECFRISLAPGLMVRTWLCEGANGVLVLWIQPPCFVDDWQDVCSCAPD